jgi:hypothetical protein
LLGEGLPSLGEGLPFTEGTEPTENITTWVFEEGSFRPAAKPAKDKKYSIVIDYLGTPAQMYDEKGQAFGKRIWIFTEKCVPLPDVL